METPAHRSSRASGPRTILAFGSLGLTALGLGLIGYDVFTHELRGASFWALLAGAIGLVGSAVWRSYDDAASAEPTLLEAGATVRGAGPYRSGPVPERWRPRHAAAVLVGVLVVVVVQALIPLRYYYGDDPYDERFSWRMFSAVRMHSCSLSAFETTGGVEQPVALQRSIQVGWITTLERNREAVTERYLRWRCEQDGVTAARLENRCRTPEGRSVPPIVRAVDCASGALHREGGLE